MSKLLRSPIFYVVVIVIVIAIIYLYNKDKKGSTASGSMNRSAINSTAGSILRSDLSNIPSSVRQSLDSRESAILSNLYNSVKSIKLVPENIGTLQGFVDRANDQFKKIGSTMIISQSANPSMQRIVCQSSGDVDCFQINIIIAAWCHCRARRLTVKDM